ncbi:MAG: 4Fe-4S dicluster domain-containing protein [Chlorobi bacterium]|nr:4Fe-4S dicluster domain-containing protein [Chlorobiota bacterium]
MLLFSSVIITGTGIVLSFLSIWMIYTFLRERVLRAVLWSVALFFIPGIMIFLFAGSLPSSFSTGMVFLIFIVTFFVILPPQVKKVPVDKAPGESLDERDIMFSRRLLRPGMPEFEDYYSRHPEKKEPDDIFRGKPGLLSPDAKLFDPFTFFAAGALFDTVETLAGDVEGGVADQKVTVNPVGMSRLLKSWAKKMGAVSSGITGLQHYHFYHTGGRSYNYGEKIVPGHKYAFAFTVEMEEGMIATGPLGPSVMESATQYLEAGKIAVVLARYIRKLGYSARAHIDGHYLVVCPLVARDAGLGEIGRMGLLMTPRLGPRVRIGVVTTDMPLQPDQYKEDRTITDFCIRCMKCADNCPVKAISSRHPKPVRGITRWQINQEACYTYWTVTGTDCGRCVAVCPYSHSDNLFHRLVRLGIRKSWLVNRLALPLDNLFYGRKPIPRQVPEWLNPDTDRITK